MKKIIASLIVIALLCSNYMADDLNKKVIAPIEVPIILIHDIADTDVSVDKLKYVLMTLKEKKRNTISMEELINYVNGKGELPQNPVMITFDDGYLSSFTKVLPLLTEYDAKATISIIGWLMGRSTFINSGQTIMPRISWMQARAMADTGRVQFINHSYDLHNMSGKTMGHKLDTQMGIEPLRNESYADYKARISKDISYNELLIENNTGKSYKIFNYPFGVYNTWGEQVLKELGFAGSMTTSAVTREYSSTKDLYNMPRYIIKQDTDIVRLMKTICGEEVEPPKYSASEPEIYFNNKLIRFYDVKPIYIEGKLYVGARELLEAMGMVINWDISSKKVVVSDGKKILRFADNSHTLQVDHNEIYTELVPKIINEKAMIPLRPIVEALGYNVIWQNNMTYIK